MILPERKNMVVRKYFVQNCLFSISLLISNASKWSLIQKLFNVPYRRFFLNTEYIYKIAIKVGILKGISQNDTAGNAKYGRTVVLRK